MKTTLPWLVVAVAAALTRLHATRADVWETAESHAAQTQEAIRFCHRFTTGWLAHADPQSGLIPRNLRGDNFWNAQDSAADNFPFMVLTAHVTGNSHLKRSLGYILDQEQRLTQRLDSLPDSYDFARQAFRGGQLDLDGIIFGASEYAKDGLMPITEWMGPGVYLARMETLIRDIWKHAAVETPSGLLPSSSLEVNGEQLQVLCRLYWLTGDPELKEWAFRLADYHLLHTDLLGLPRLRLRDHGCEILGGLSEAYFLASREDSARHGRYRQPLYRILDNILAHGVNDDGMMWNWYVPQTGENSGGEVSDSWGYVYNAFLTVAQVDGHRPYQEAVQHALEQIHGYLETDWEGGSADGYADSIEGALNLLNRLPVPTGFDWVEKSVPFILQRQRPDGVIEGWHGDGNSARTLLMYVLWKTQGVTASPWRDDVRLGAVTDEAGAVHLSIQSDFAWQGTLQFDRRRHQAYFHLPQDYPRINQFPEWYTVDPGRQYQLIRDEEAPVTVEGRELWQLPVTLAPGQRLRLTVQATPARLRTAAYRPGTPAEAQAWQADLRSQFFRLLGLDDLVALNPQENPLQPVLLRAEDKPHCRWHEYQVQLTPHQAVPVVVTLPSPRPQQPAPAVVCIHGHGGDRYTPYDSSTVYKGFAAQLAERGFVTISADVGQHAAPKSGLPLMGGRLWTLMRCVDFLSDLPEVDPQRIGCAGLSLGGEMAMWLGAMDPRLAATVSSGFLTTMDQMEVHHCRCWKFDGLRERVDWADVYAMIAPRPLQCQNGRLEPPRDFTVAIARQAIQEVRQAYTDWGAADQLQWQVHSGGHEIDLPALLEFLQQHLRP